ncbi:hypothetical protein A1E_03745 [Rickettsia canadensis str. McKiel]|uniref:Uncharacterized protein n=1 Tax=Rickettsia canadensis (strain McKiel) TaxID=293613 RepID=A8EZ95_RICCK|nr:hypothetical protein [Rickettsia canadensis]ABV73678.1 hypothetical protein A1E_03745 [Rickettsia canadensis str. McKiel]
MRIKLNELLNKNWIKEYKAKELRQDKLGYFIDYCLYSKDIALQELINISDKYISIIITGQL